MNRLVSTRALLRAIAFGAGFAILGMPVMFIGGVSA